ncbi:hypothetical protein ACQUFY_26960 (plasmid) [Robbsia andropogonis]|uniref:hypothetical protein n=1 Tax=Robbsia andropogonis TaxID=28092 RepID=UPI003D1A0731
MKNAAFIGAFLTFLSMHATAQSNPENSSAVYRSADAPATSRIAPLGEVSAQQVAYGLRKGLLCIGPNDKAYSKGAEIVLQNHAFTCAATYSADVEGRFSATKLEWVRDE